MIYEYIKKIVLFHFIWKKLFIKILTISFEHFLKFCFFQKKIEHMEFIWS